LSLFGGEVVVVVVGLLVAVVVFVVVEDDNEDDGGGIGGNGCGVSGGKLIVIAPLDSRVLIPTNVVFGVMDKSPCGGIVAPPPPCISPWTLFGVVAPSQVAPAPLVLLVVVLLLAGMALVAVAVSEFDSLVLVFVAVVGVGVVCRRRRVGSVVFGVVEFALEGVVLVAVAGAGAGVVVVDLMTRKGDPLIPRPPIMMEGPPRPFIVVFLPDCACP